MISSTRRTDLLSTAEKEDLWTLVPDGDSGIGYWRRIVGLSDTSEVPLSDGGQ
ncbi:MAG TPA: hypothetical protein VG711_10225 [Phycisphaerales bacterium]|nr:hypothetical protein [Phycisphaerales bacterium]